MLEDLIEDRQIYIACGRTDMRKNIDGLAALVVQKFGLDPMEKKLFLFCGRKQDRIKALYFEENGFVLLYKRFETGRLQWPKDEEEVKRITPQQLRWLLEGLSIHQPKSLRKLSSKKML